MKAVNLIVAITNNHAAISRSIKQAAQGLIEKGDISDGILNMVEMGIQSLRHLLRVHNTPSQDDSH